MSLAKISATTRELNTLCDESSVLVRQVEEFLDEANLGLAATILYSNHSDGERHIYWYLSYRYVNGRYGIYVCKDINKDHKLVEWYVIPWSSAPRPVRIEAIKHLPKLLTELNSRARLLLETARHSVVGVREAVSHFIRQAV